MYAMYEQNRFLYDMATLEEAKAYLKQLHRFCPPKYGEWADKI